MRRILAFGGALAWLAALCVAPASAQSITTNQTMDDCKLIPDDAARLACYDRVIKSGRQDVPGSASPSLALPSGGGGAAGGGAAGDVGSQVSKGGVVSAPKTAEERREDNKKAFGLPAYVRDQSSGEREERKIEKVKEVSTQIATVGEVGPNRLRVMTTDGQVWDQIEGDAARGRAGDSFRVKQGFMGGMMCKVGNNVAYRCVRSDRPGQS